LLTRAYRQRVSALAAGIDINNLRSEHLDDLLIPVPPLAEQRRIAQILEKANGLRVKRRAAFFQLDALIGSVFAEMFGPLRSAPVTIADVGEKSHAQGWPWVLLTDVARLATGHTPDRTRSDCWGGATPWITLTEIRGLDGKVAFDTREHVSEAGLRNSAAVKLPPGTVCSSRTASVGFVTIMGREMSTSQDFVNWVCGEALHPVYLMHALLQSRARLRSLSTVLRPPKSLQTKFASRVRLVKQLQEQQSASVVHLDALFDALQTNAFSEVIAGDVVVGNIKNLK
jgi:type I restriction enzyme S subunit